MKILYGAAKPIEVAGKNQTRILDFAYNNRCWHYMQADYQSKQAYKALVNKDVLEVEGQCYRFKYPEDKTTFNKSDMIKFIDEVTQ